MAEEYVTPRQAAKELGISPEALYVKLKANVIPSKTIEYEDRFREKELVGKKQLGPKFLILRSDLDAYKKKQQECPYHLNGRPSKKDIVVKWKNENPHCSKYRCARALKITYNTVSKYWTLLFQKKKHQLQLKG